MTQKILASLLAAAIVLAAAPARAANREHQQLMADLRILQEQSQLLQNMLGTLAEAVKAVNARLEQQTEVERRAFADEKLLVDTLQKDLSVMREKVDDNNVRVGSLSQEIDALRQLLQQALARQTSSSEPTATSPLGPASSTPPGAGVTTPTAAGASPTKTYDQAYGDYAAGLYD